MNIHQLLIRYGLSTSDLGKHTSHYSHTEVLLDTTLDLLRITPDEIKAISEDSFKIALLTASSRMNHYGGETLINPLHEELPLASIDLHMRGICRWMNELGMHTLTCCEGHGRRVPMVGTWTQLTSDQLELLHGLAPAGMSIRARNKSVYFECDGNMELLLQLAERLYEVFTDQMSIQEYHVNMFKHRLIEYLMITGESGNEEQMRSLIRHQLKLLTDDQFMDPAGNLCATFYCGQGPTVLLSAHMDIYQELEEDRKIMEENTLLRSSSGILGADDRAGIAIIMEIVSRIHRTNFNGTLKLAFTVEEEIGLIGAQNLDPLFLADVDAAIVVDRRGKRDIVTSCAGIIPFCNEAYGQIFEEAGRLAGMEDWKVTAGGSSDAKILSQQFGIPAVNLSAGYMNEHTDQETVDYLAAYQTVNLIESVFRHQLITCRDKQAVI